MEIDNSRFWAVFLLIGLVLFFRILVTPCKCDCPQLPPPPQKVDRLTEISILLDSLDTIAIQPPADPLQSLIKHLQ